MANEWVLVTQRSLPINMTISSTAAIEKGGALVMSDPNTAAAHTAALQAFAGVCATEKLTGDGKTNVSVYRDGRFKVTLSGSCLVGDALVLSWPINQVQSAAGLTAAQVSGSRIIGRAAETGATTETILIDVFPVTSNAIS